MTKKFEYLSRIVVENDIEIEDIAECAIMANNDLDERWYLIVSTELGVTDIFEMGPVIDNMEMLPDFYSCTYKRIGYSEYKISKAIDSFLNNPSRGITQAIEVSKEEAKSKFFDLARFIK